MGNDDGGEMAWTKLDEAETRMATSAPWHFELTRCVETKRWQVGPGNQRHR